MSLGTSLSIASSGLNAVQYELAVSSQNVSNASTPGFVTETANMSSRDAGGAASGVVVQPITLAVNNALQSSLYAENASVAGLGVTVNALAAVSAAQGSTTDATDSNTLTSLIGNLQDGFTTLDDDPSSAVQQQTVVDGASALAGGINTLSSTYQTQRQEAQAAIPATLDDQWQPHHYRGPVTADHGSTGDRGRHSRPAEPAACRNDDVVEFPWGSYSRRLPLGT